MAFYYNDALVNIKCITIGGNHDYIMHLISRNEYQLLTVSAAKNGNPLHIFNLILLPQP